jgi:hypothetical protein
MTLSTIFLYGFNWSNIHTLAFLYTDPGSGALLWQLLLASFFGALFYARSFIRRIQSMISGRRGERRSDQQAIVDRTSPTTPNQDRLP